MRACRSNIAGLRISWSGLRLRCDDRNNESVASAELQAQFAQLGIQPNTGSPQEFAAFFAAENRKWASIVEDADISAE